MNTASSLSMVVILSLHPPGTPGSSKLAGVSIGARASSSASSNARAFSKFGLKFVPHLQPGSESCLSFLKPSLVSNHVSSARGKNGTYQRTDEFTRRWSLIVTATLRGKIPDIK